MFAEITGAKVMTLAPVISANILFSLIKDCKEHGLQVQYLCRWPLHVSHVCLLILSSPPAFLPRQESRYPCVGAHNTFIAIHHLCHSSPHLYAATTPYRHFFQQSVPHLHFSSAACCTSLPMQEPAGLEHAYAHSSQ